MKRISIMLFGVGLLAAISTWTSPASAWDDDDDDDGYRRRPVRYFAPVPVAPVIPVAPVVIPPSHRHYAPVPAPPRAYGPPLRRERSVVVPPAPVPDVSPIRGPELPPLAPPPLAPPVDEGPIVPPLPPSLLQQEFAPPGYVEPAAPLDLPIAHTRPGNFIEQQVSLYPHVRVKDRDNIPRGAVHRVVAVSSPDPFRFPGCVFVQICVPPGRCPSVKFKSGGSKLELKYPNLEVEITSRRGVITVDYDD